MDNYKHLYEQTKLMLEKYQDEIVPGLREQLERVKRERDELQEKIGEAYSKGRQSALDEIAYAEQTGLVLVETPLLEEYIKIGTTDHLRELAQAEKDGRLVVLPCKVGDTVWVVFGDSARKAVYKTRVQGISITTRSTAILNFGGYPVQYAWAYEVGKTVFLTREEAEAAMKGGDEG